MKKITVDTVVEAYVKTREEISELTKAFEAKERELKAVQANRESWLKEQMINQGTTGFKTDFGSVYPLVKESVKVADWDTFLEDAVLRPMAKQILGEFFEGEVGEEDIIQMIETMKESGGTEYLNKAANKTACLELMGERVKGKGRPNSPPRGISYEAFETVGVRKS